MKISLILGILVMLASGYFAWVNFEELKAARTEKDKLNAEIRRMIADIQETDEDIRAEFAVLAGLEDDRDETVVKLEQAQRQLASLTSQEEGLVQDLESQEAEIARYERELERLPPGFTIDNVQQKLDEMRNVVSGQETEIDNLEDEISTLEGGIARNQETLDGYVSRQAERRKAFDLNSSEGLITAINRDWGFAVVNLGEKSGVSADSSFIVKRGVQSLGKLSVMSIESNSTVCNIIYETIPEGMQFQAGDRVILENLSR